MKTRLTAMRNGAGHAMIIAHHPPSGGVAGHRARVASVTKDDATGRWTALLFGKGWPLSELLPEDPQVITSVQSDRNMNGKHTLADVLDRLQRRDEWWAQ